jgi:hypothetical protein
MKNIKSNKKLNLKSDILRTLGTTELRGVEGGVSDSLVLKCNARPTAASTGMVCCA